MGETRKVTVELPDKLLTSVQTEAGMGVTETIREALEQMRQRQTKMRCESYMARSNSASITTCR